MKIYKSTNNKGQSLFELVVAIAISALIIVTIVSLTTNSIQNSNFSKNRAVASSYAQQAMEWLRGQRDKDVEAFIDHAVTPLWCLKDISTDATGWSKNGPCSNDDFIGGTRFIRQVEFVVTTQSGKEVIESVVTVTWSDSQGVHEVRTATNLIDPR